MTARRVAPGAQALLSSIAAAGEAGSPPIDLAPVVGTERAPRPLEDRAVDAGLLRVSAQPSPRPAGGIGEVVLPRGGLRPSTLLPPPTTPAPLTTPAPAKAPAPATSSPAPAKAPAPAASPAPITAPALATPPGPGPPPPAAESVPSVEPWRPSDDDILPAHGARRRMRLRLR